MVTGFGIRSLPEDMAVEVERLPPPPPTAPPPTTTTTATTATATATATTANEDMAVEGEKTPEGLVGVMGKEGDA